MRSPRAVGGLLVFALAAVVGTWALARVTPSAALLATVVPVACLLMILGEQLTLQVAGRVLAPVTTAAALGLILSPVQRDGEGLTAATTIALIWLSMLTGTLLAKARGQAIGEPSLGARFLGLAVTAGLGQTVRFDGVPVVEPAFADDHHPVVAALALLGVAAVGGLVERAIETVTAWGAEGLGWRAILTNEFGSLTGITLATVSSGPLIAMSYLVIGWIALPLFLVPILVVLFTVRRVAAMRQAQEQAIEALSRLSELAGVSPSGHTHRVAAMSTRIARRMPLDEASVRRVERTALLHDIGLLGLPVAAHGSVGVLLTEEDERSIDDAERRILREPGIFADVRPLVAQVRTPFRRYRELGEAIPLASRIVRVASAWDDITEGATSRRAQAIALERLHLGLGYEYDPEVVDALEDSLPPR